MDLGRENLKSLKTCLNGDLRWFECPGPDLNRHDRLTESQDFKSIASMR